MISEIAMLSSTLPAQNTHSLRLERFRRARAFPRYGWTVSGNTGRALWVRVSSLYSRGHAIPASPRPMARAVAMRYLTHLLYTSRATFPFTQKELRTLAADSADRNHSVAVTGILLYSAGSFLQLLEGRAQTLDALMKRILQDERHTDVTELLRAPASGRLFSKWHMGVLNLDVDGSELDRSRLAEVLKQGQDEQGSSGTRALAVLRDFREQLPSPGA